jgi:hypothetical protein
VTSLIGVSLTQFLDFTLKGSGVAKSNHVYKVKYDSDYSPAKDYWKQLRDAIKKVHENNLPIDSLYNVLDKVNDRKKANYQKSISQYVNFAKKKDISWFETGSSYWSFNNELTVRSSPEIGLKIDGVPYLLKIYYKGKGNRVDKHKVQSTLTLMNASKRDFVPPTGALPALLNLNNKNFYDSSGIDKSLLLALEGDASQFVYLWNNL